MHTLIIKVPTKTKDYNNIGNHLTEMCHNHAAYIKNSENEDYLDRCCPLEGFQCPFTIECQDIEPDDWFSILIIDSHPWN